jgi:hypothetical protein
MERKFTTYAAAQFCTDNGRKISHRTLQKYRTKGRDDPGECGPKFYRDPITGTTLYLESDLRKWIADLENRLIERGSMPQPAHLASAA